MKVYFLFVAVLLSACGFGADRDKEAAQPQATAAKAAVAFSTPNAEASPKLKVSPVVVPTATCAYPEDYWVYGFLTAQGTVVVLSTRDGRIPTAIVGADDSLKEFTPCSSGLAEKYPICHKAVGGNIWVGQKVLMLVNGQWVTFWGFTQENRNEFLCGPPMAVP